LGLFEERPAAGRDSIGSWMGAAPVSRYLCDKWLREAERLAGVEKLDGRLWHAYRAKFAKGKLLTGFCWDFFSTVTFKDPVSFDFADRAVERFVRSLDDTAYAFHGLERGRVGEHVHSHVLLGGIKPRRQRNVIWFVSGAGGAAEGGDSALVGHCISCTIFVGPASTG
jgi:hypothetical protein